MFLFTMCKFKRILLFCFIRSYYFANVLVQYTAGCYHLTGLVHILEVSWDLVQDVRDVLHEGDEVRVKIIKIDR